MAGFPKGPEELTIQWLSEAVGGKVTGFEAEQFGQGVGIVGRMYRIKLEGEGVPATVVAKFPTLDALARQVVFEPLRFYQKEVLFYGEVAGHMPLATPAVYAAEVDDQQDFVLLFEDLGRLQQFDQLDGCSLGQAQAAVDALADVHTKWWNADALSQLGWLPVLEDPVYIEVLSGLSMLSWPKFVQAVGDRVPADILGFMERFGELMPWFCSETSREPFTFVHGDYRLDNFFFPSGPGDPPITVADWQVCFKGPGGYDLGYFISQSLTTEARRAHETDLIERYRRRLSETGIEYPRLEEDYRRTILYGLYYPLVGFGQIELENERAVQLESQMLDRAIAAVQDHEALSVLPS